jgi:uncharacterized protein YggE
MMKSTLALILLTGCFAVCAHAQVVSTRSIVSASGQATISVPPDTAKVDVTVTASGATAGAAASKDATQVTAVLTALTSLLGAGADIKTINYFVGPAYDNQGRPNGSYNASSTLEITLTNLSLAGSVIDTAVGAGATSVGGVQFTLQNSDAAHNQALAAATVQAVGHANSMAKALSRTVGNVITVSEIGSVPTPIFTGVAAGGAAPTTPVVPGLLQVQVNVTIQAELN